MAGLLVIWAAGCIYNSQRTGPEAGAPDRPADLAGAPDKALADRLRGDQALLDWLKIDRRLVDRARDQTPPTDWPRDATPLDRLPDKKTCASACPNSDCATRYCDDGVCALKAVAGALCRKSTGPCDPDDYCDGKLTDCPPNATWGTSTISFHTKFGYEGFIANSSGSYVSGSQFVQAGNTNLTTGEESRGFVLFDTSSLSGGVVLGATLKACTAGGAGSGLATVYQVDDPIGVPFDAQPSTTFNIPATSLAITMPDPDLNVPSTVTVPISSVKMGGATQYSLRLSSTTGVFRRWHVSADTVAACGGQASWVLEVVYCGP